MKGWVGAAFSAVRGALEPPGRGFGAPNVRLGDIFRGIVPFLAVDIVTIVLFIAWPEIVTFLPSLMLNN